MHREYVSVGTEAANKLMCSENVKQTSMYKTTVQTSILQEIKNG